MRKSSSSILRSQRAARALVSLFLGLVGFVIPLSVSAIDPAGATPAYCPLTSHPYSIAQMTSASYGGYTTVYVVHGSAADWTSGAFVDEELWVGTDNGPPGSNWVEVGYTYGNLTGYTGPGPNWFWADQRPNGGSYNEHLTTFPNPSNYWNQNISVAASYTGSNTWKVYIGGTHQGTSTANPGVSGYLQAGLEACTSSGSSYLNGSVDGSLEWQDYTGAWHSDWPSATGIVDSPAAGAWYINDYVWTNSF
jgi:hypothetical protein